MEYVNYEDPQSLPEISEKKNYISELNEHEFQIWMKDAKFNINYIEANSQFCVWRAVDNTYI